MEGAINTRTKATALAALLLVLSAAEGAVLFYVTGPGLRLVLGILLLIPIVLTSSRLGVADHFLQLVSRKTYSRRQVRLRSLLDELLDEARRLNATALDGKRGVRDQEKTKELMDSREAALHALVGRIRDAAGEESDQPAH